MARLTKTTYRGICFIDGKEANILKGHRCCVDHHDPKRCPKCRVTPLRHNQKPQPQPVFYGGRQEHPTQKRVRHIQL